MPIISFSESNSVIDVAEGTLLIDAIRAAGFSIDAPCGGHGKCGKCHVEIQSGSSPGVYPACSYSVSEDISIRFPTPSAASRILEDGTEHEAAEFSCGVPDPHITSVDAFIPACAIGESFSESQCVKRVFGEQTEIPLCVAASLHEDLTSLKRKGSFVFFGNRLLDIREKKRPVYVQAFDIGTTTIVSYLLDGETGRQVCVSSMMNPQTAYGGDVISRSEYDTSHEGKELTRLVRSALRALTEKNIEKAGITPEDIYFTTIAGNTCMQHLFLGVSPGSLLCAPYTATVDEIQFLSSKEAGLPIHPAALVAVLPCIAGFVGGDTVAVLLSLPKMDARKLTLVLDIGTNGELVLARGNLRYTCSTAAGPAFEGARISCGMRGAQGAIDRAFLEEGELRYTTIGGVPPTGICGSGLIDLVRCLLDLHILSERGRIEKPSSWPPETAARYGHRFIKVNGISSFLLTDDEHGIYLTQKDVREVQLAKAAIASGIELLCKTMGVSVDEIQTVLLAGAFGNYLAPESACRLGMIPSVLLDRIRSIGNAAGEGAKMAALSRSALKESALLARETHFIELAALPEFQKAYLSHLNF